MFNPNGRRHFRRSYSLGEVRYSLLAIAALAAITVWVGWRGAHPDPELLALETSLLDEGSAEAPERARKMVTGTSPGGTSPGAAEDERGPVPTGLAAPGWRERGVSSFTRDNLYEKINGRAGYYEAFGVEMLYFVTLVNEEDEGLVVDIEMYDQGELANALGAYAGERQPDATPTLEDGSLGHTARNAMFLVRGRFYVRAIGSDENEPVLAQLAHLREALIAGIEAEPLPWAYSLFIAVDADPGKIAFVPENAFSFGFASNVYSAEISEDGAELFAVATVDDAAAAKLAAQFTEGFASYGEALDGGDGVQWIEDQYISTIAGATARGSLVLGVRGAADRDSAAHALEALLAAAAKLPEEVRAAAQAQAEAPAGADAAEDDEDGEAGGEHAYGDGGDGDGGGGAAGDEDGDGIPDYDEGGEGGPDYLDEYEAEPSERDTP
ncbi:hypothetical protein Hoch_0563 [Haliangium ochraceum DSM 14365]|uniref:Uncharacterized protein n=1 Tax=Haliangium ochraceum (strain DSM 14365 / JCM 11303 / SMP-2) TaxID=502025 RepID=D0LLI4_HALO1|nr:hypothetical protein Hoch_0563 [Haliangium ochraceum DSM 14365]